MVGKVATQVFRKRGYLPPPAPRYCIYNNVIQCFLMALGIILLNSCKSAMEVRIIFIILILQIKKLTEIGTKASKVHSKHQRAKLVKDRCPRSLFLLRHHEHHQALTQSSLRGGFDPRRKDLEARTRQ